MPVMPAPTTSTSTAATGSEDVTKADCTDRLVSFSMAVPFAMDLPDRVPKQRYFDPGFYALECEELWPRVWQMACRLEEIPEPHDYAEYEFLDQSVVVVRTE